MVQSVAEIWRYPVKSMRGEKLSETQLGKGGIPFDRGWAVRDEADKTIRGAKLFAGLLNCSARYLMDTQAEPVPTAEITLPDGRRINSDDAKVNGALSEVVGRAVTLWPLQPRENEAHYRSAPVADIEAYLRQIFGLEANEPIADLSAFPPDVLAEISQYASPRGTYFDAFPVNVLSEASLRYMRKLSPESIIDVRRFRPNFLIGDEGSGGAHPVEFDWVGREIALGGARIAAVMRCPRCIMTTRAQEGHGAALPRDSAIMRALVRETAQNLSIYATVVREGRVAVGDAVSP